jgi:hypothetical protein
MVASLQKRELFARRAMRLVSSTLLDRGVPAARIRYESSGPTCGLLRRHPVRRADGDVPSRKSEHCF